MQDSDMKKDITIVILFVLLAYPQVVLAAHYTQSYNFTRQKKLMISSIPVFTIELHVPAICNNDSGLPLKISKAYLPAGNRLNQTESNI